jgi:hypothetical protein
MTTHSSASSYTKSPVDGTEETLNSLPAKPSLQRVYNN